MPKKTATVKCYRNEKAPYDAIYVYKSTGEYTSRLQSPKIDKIAEMYAHDWIVMNMRVRKGEKLNYTTSQRELDRRAQMKSRLLAIFAKRGWT